MTDNTVRPSSTNGLTSGTNPAVAEVIYEIPERSDTDSATFLLFDDRATGLICTFVFSSLLPHQGITTWWRGKEKGGREHHSGDQTRIRTLYRLWVWIQGINAARAQNCPVPSGNGTMNAAWVTSADESVDVATNSLQS